MDYVIPKKLSECKTLFEHQEIMILNQVKLKLRNNQICVPDLINQLCDFIKVYEEHTEYKFPMIIDFIRHIDKSKNKV